ncbi:MAG TPA: LUD domain-containing protein [Saprospiraceae bacterium]|nr:LUD domain-containing protein [Saprospiraceae bacterium]
MKTSKEHILENIRKNKPEYSPQNSKSTEKTKLLPEWEKFAVKAQTAGSTIIFTKEKVNVDAIIQEIILSAGINEVQKKNPDNTKNEIPVTKLNKIEEEFVVLEAVFGICENGAFWYKAHTLEDRKKPFIHKNVIVIVDAYSLVDNMHDAYERIEGMEFSYGVFIGGPSKTADIEQTLVIGAQGALKQWIIIVNAR